MKEKLLISACLLGVGCRYDGGRVKKVDAEALAEKYELVPVCPEIYGGLPTPRVPSERIGDRVMMKDGTDVTENFKRGLEHTLMIAEACGARLAPFDIKELRDLMEYDELELDTLGDEKTALFVILSDTDSTFNFVAALMYSQLFNLLCDKVWYLTDVGKLVQN